MNLLQVIFIFFLAGPALAMNLLQDFDSLGGNADLLKKLKANPENRRIEIVQKRITDRTHRFELSTEYLQTSRGNSYLDTTGSGFALSYHLNPRWSFGLKYNYFFNELTSEGEHLMGEAQKVEEIDSEAEIALVPELNWPKASIMSSVSFYPIYGKINIFNFGIIHFDTYGTLGAGWMNLREGDSPLYLMGAGFGFWISRHFTSRLEYNYQMYNAEYLTGSRPQRINTLSFGIGFFL